ncbi:MAG: outer membrane beta-barrel domain-containing protein [Myxococcaceae bacterium]|jgi:outer membrane beta-barrel protein|nr:outer membrane beta-barrel domain-containing protein [Myxococcaceae bacterium]
MLPSFLRSTLMIAALLVGGQAAAATSWLSAPSMLVLAQAGAAADDDEDEPAKPAEKKPDAPAAATPTTPTAPPDAPAVAPAGATATASAEQMKLVNGAPLFNPNVGVHIVEQKRFSDSGRFEVTVYPVALQVNGKFTQHFGTMGQLTYHLQENFGLMITGGGNWFNAESSLNGELVEKARVEAQAASSLLWTWGVMGGVEVTPFYGKFTLFEGTLAQFSFVINGGAGIGGTRHQLKPENTRQDGTISPATYGDTGLRFMAALGAGFRLQLGNRFAFRLEVRDVVYTARVEQVNGCNVEDLRAMDTALRAGRPVSSATVGGGCRVDTFDGTDENGLRNSNNVPLALGLVRTPSSDVLNNVGLYAGLSILF